MSVHDCYLVMIAILIELKLGKEILLMEITKTKPMCVGVDEVCADWGVSRSKGYAIIKQLSVFYVMRWKIISLRFTGGMMIPDSLTFQNPTFIRRWIVVSGRQG